jgi:hypothetical protein
MKLGIFRLDKSKITCKSQFYFLKLAIQSNQFYHAERSLIFNYSYLDGQ